MKNHILLCCLFLIGVLSCTPATDSAESSEDTDMIETTVSAEEQAINQAVLDAYAGISFEKGATPDYEALRAIFTPNAVLQNFRNDTLQSFPIDAFIESFKAGIDNGGRLGFNEVELGGETEYFGKVGHRISAYASYFDGSDEVGERGVNSFQLMKIDGKWLVSSIIWDVEKEGQSIPERYIAEE